ncbi:hypothetical protein ACOXXX_18195 [Thalassococcus sp. BH17M4-6]|uniref:hypothetical protein n=1 Tax=Thalassococcus sp. BH17M4-6 TaxID=3413148 RepID=UPI003BBBE5EB
MIRRLILHVGSPKCGSTFLQQGLLRNQAPLLDHGIRYPHDGGGHPGNAAEIDKLDRAGYEALFADGVHTVILSHEDLYSMARRGGPLAELVRRDGAGVHILAFLRPFSEFVFGDYSQFMKQFFERFLQDRRPYDGQSFDAFALRRVEKLQPVTFLSNWQRCFDGAPITVSGHRSIRDVVQGLLGPDVPIDWEVPHHQTNPSLRMIDCDRIAAAMRDPSVPEDKIRALFGEAFHLAGTPDPGRSPSRIARIEAAFAAQNAALRETFGYDNTLPGFSEPAI